MSYSVIDGVCSKKTKPQTMAVTLSNLNQFTAW